MVSVRLDPSQRFDPSTVGELLQQAESIIPAAARPLLRPVLDTLMRGAGLNPAMLTAMQGVQLPSGNATGLLDSMPFFGPGNDLGTLRAAPPTPTAAETRRAERMMKKLGYRPGQIEQFQAAVGLPETGVADRATLRRLDSTTKRIKKAGDGYLTPGMKNRRVKDLQQRLARLGDFQGTPTGIYDQETSRASRTFRRRHDNLQQGIKSFGKTAQRALNMELDNIAHDPFRTRVDPSSRRRELDARVLSDARDGGVGTGSSRSVIAHVQRELTAAGYNPNRTDGVWDNHTQAMLHQFQRRSGIEETERLGPNTWGRLRGSTIETEANYSPKQMIGERGSAVRRTEQRLKKAGYNPGEVDGRYTAATERAADRLRARYDRPEADGVSLGTAKLITKRIKERNGLVKPIAARLTSISEFGVQDAEGAPANNGARYHAGKDWFAPGGSRVRSPIAGRVVEVRASSGNSGQVFGGTVKVQGNDGKVWVFRHVDPTNVRLGQRVDAGDTIARITRWADGPSHAHIELWKTLSGGYDFENMIDPMRYLRRFL
jgi:peptidoglycan hydrolase-like protein with peptidoglycan-binding domain